MIRSELFKITRHRTPWVISIVYSLFVLAGPIYFMFKQPAEASTYLETVTAIYAVAGLLLVPIFGAWIVGNEYRHGTMRRVLAVDARRGKLLRTKAALGFGSALAALTAVGGIGIGGAALAAARHGDSLVLDGVVRSLASGAFIALVSGVIAFGLSIILRSDTYAMLGSLGVMVVFGPLLVLIPTVGKYTPFAVSADIAERIEDASSTGAISLAAASATLGITLAVIGIAGSRLFATRDI